MQKESKRCTSLDDDICLCSIEGIMGILSKKWALLIISAIGNNQKLRYNELEKKLGEISPKTLADRLKGLENASLIKRESFAEIPPRVEYSLTKEGAELRNAITPLLKWVSSRDFQK
ncbi:HxlR-like helix-turn-helix [uncultured archaeon]|nr:HxlR-like helix-turn-helix [uncultured archaeon]